MSSRAVHLVGSYPASTAQAAMNDIAGRAGLHLRSMPDGETGERSSWVVGTIERFRDHPDVELRSDGDWSNYKRCPTFRPVNRLRPEAVPLSLAADARASYEHFDKVRADQGLNLDFQVGVPSDLDLSAFTFGFGASAFRHRGIFRDALASQIREIDSWAGRDVIYQLECPAEVVMVASAGPLRHLAARRLAAGLVRVVEAAPAHTRWGVHLCVGDLGHQALMKLTSTRPLVALSRALVAAWPRERSLEYLHLPLASGTQPPPLDFAFYRGLADLATLPDSLRLVAGLGHDHRTLGELQQVLHTVEFQVGRPVDIARPCGLGRQDATTAARALERDVELAQSLDTVEPLPTATK